LILRQQLFSCLCCILSARCFCTSSFVCEQSAANTRANSETRDHHLLPLHALNPRPCRTPQVARVAKLMITQMGMSERLGQVAWSQQGGQSFVGQQMGQPADCSDATYDIIDEEIKAIVNRSYRCAFWAGN